jgi:hypothetical protein
MQFAQQSVFGPGGLHPTSWARLNCVAATAESARHCLGRHDWAFNVHGMPRIGATALSAGLH